MHSAKPLFLVSAFVLIAPALPAAAATLCVNTGGAGCYTTISKALLAAAPGDVINVGPGTYNESLLINKSVSLVGNGATIDATGMPVGIFADGLHYPGLNAVRIAGFTVKNADREGIFVLNATDVAVSGNTVLNNDRSLTPTGCPNLPSYEPGEAMDCGEGVHLQGVSYSILTQNTVQNNSGGILMSDDTGPTHHNLVSFNTVSDNVLACGITMASHAPSTAPTGNGVFQNTIYANRSQRNGTNNSSGAGIGLFVGVPGGATYDNTVVDNLATENGLPGVAMHAHAPGESLNSNMIVGNTLSGNGADTQDAFTPGPTGINIYAVPPSYGNRVSDNIIQNESYDVVLNIPALQFVQFNNLLGLGVGVLNEGSGPVDATQNWWSCPSGPTIAGSCSMAVGGNIVWQPWLTSPIPSQPNY